MTDTQRLFEEYRPFAGQLYSAVLADVLDGLGYTNQALPVPVKPLNPEWKMLGKVRTLDMHGVSEVPAAPYALEMEAIDELTAGDVLVIRMGGCPECAVWGELLSTACLARGACGAVMDGPTRDVEKILSVDFPTFAIGTSPLDSKGRIDGVARDVAVTIGQTRCEPGDLIFGDRDGVVVIPAKVAAETLAAAKAKILGENRVREALLAGRSVREVFAEFGIL